MRGVSGPPLPYRDFYYPLNVFMHILTHEEGGVTYLHYGLFERDGDALPAAQERSTELLLSRLPAPPARLLDVGIGLGTTLERLTRIGYAAEGITPDDQQVAMVRARYGDRVRVQCTRFEDFAVRSYDAVIFQESSQYIDSNALFAKARELTQHVIVLDEFALQEAEGATLHRLDAFLAAAEQHGFRKSEELDLSEQAAPTVDYFTPRLPRYRELLNRDLGLTSQQVDDLIESGHRYRDLYRRGVYGYRLLVFHR
jgi:SAM-dependent methyltransferase